MAFTYPGTARTTFDLKVLADYCGTHSLLQRDQVQEQYNRHFSLWCQFHLHTEGRARDQTSNGMATNRRGRRWCLCVRRFERRKGRGVVMEYRLCSNYLSLGIQSFSKPPSLHGTDRESGPRFTENVIVCRARNLQSSRIDLADEGGVSEGSS